jgi:hypothetical protein
VNEQCVDTQVNCSFGNAPNVLEKYVQHTVAGNKGNMEKPTKITICYDALGVELMLRIVVNSMNGFQITRDSQFAGSSIPD